VSERLFETIKPRLKYMKLVEDFFAMEKVGFLCFLHVIVREIM
jgi:hypothetical protein